MEQYSQIKLSLSGAGLSDSVFEKINSDAVPKYLKQCCKKREKMKRLLPLCIRICRNETYKLEWGDECFNKFVMEMIEGADVSQLEVFYRKYIRTQKKTLVFLNFVKNEL